MIAFFIYLLKVSAALSIASVGYFFLLRNSASLNVRRFFLLAALLLAWLAPSLHLAIPRFTPEITPVFVLDPIQLSEPSVVNAASLADITNTGFHGFAVLIYGAGMLLLLLRLFVPLLTITRIPKQKDGTNSNVWFTDEKRIFTLFSKIYLPLAEKNASGVDSILIHERAHIRQWHIIDVFIAEFSLIMTWFNPFSWLISRMIKENHEYLADRAVLFEGVSPGHYKALLLEHTVGGPLFRLGHHLNHSLTKKRFIMMKKTKSTRRGIIHSSLITAALLSFVLVITANCQGNKTIEGRVVLGPEDVPGTGTSVILKGTTLGTVVDEEGSFRLELPDEITNPELVFSYVGYRSEIVDAYAANGTTTRLTPQAYTLDLDGVKGKPAPVETKKEQKIEGQKDSFYIVEDMPSFPGGHPALVDYLQKNITYPEKSREQGVQGKVMVEFTVGTSGAISEAKVLSSPSDELTAEALRLVENMPAWKPGKQRGKPVKCKIVLPVQFSLDKE